MKRLLILLVIGTTLLAAGATARTVVSMGGLSDLYVWPEEPNLVTNSSFEDVTAGGKAQGWKISESIYFVPVTGVAHSGQRSLQLKDSHLSRATPDAVQALALAPGWYSVRGWVKGDAAGEARREAGGRVNLSWGRGWMATPMVRGTTDWTKVERRNFQVPSAATEVRLEAFAKPDGTLFFDDIEVRRQTPPLVDGFLRWPNYRGMLFDDRAQVIRMGITAHAEEARLKPSDLTVRLTLVKESGGEVVASAEQALTAPVLEMSLDATKAPQGAYLLKLQARHAGGAFDYPAHRIVKLPAELRKEMGVYVDPDNVLVLNGQRAFVLGIFDTSGRTSTVPGSYAPRLADLARAPFNLYIDYQQGNAPVEALRALLTALQKHGLWYLHTVNAWYPDNHWWSYVARTKCNGTTAAEHGADAFTACMAGGMARTPGFAGWYTGDEAPADRIEPVFHQYRILRGAGDGIAMISQNKPRELPRWRDAVDVMSVDPFPIVGVPEGRLSPLEMVTDWVEQAQAAVQQSRPVWGDLQFFQVDARGHWPTQDELRSMSYLAIVGGARGLLYWSYGERALSWEKNPQRREELFQRLIAVTREIKGLEPVLLARDAPDVLAAPAPAPVRVLAKRAGGARYLITVNGSPRDVEAAFALSAPARTVEVVGEARSVQPAPGNRFTDRFAPYAAHVYRLADDAR